MRQPLAYIHQALEVADNVVVEPFVTIDKNVVIEEGLDGSSCHDYGGCTYW